MCIRDRIYFGEPRGIKPIDNGERKGINTHIYTSSEIVRVAKVAFDLAKKRSKIFSTLKKAIEISTIPIKKITQKQERII